MKKHTAYIGIGSNIGNKLNNCQKAVSFLGMEVVKISRWYESEALLNGTPPEGTPFVNGTVEIRTPLEPRGLLERLAGIEREMGRPFPRPKNEPRVIDLDILFFDSLILDLDDLKIPHPEIPKRLFVLSPLCDIAPMLRHPVLKKTIEELEKECLKSGPKTWIEILSGGTG